MSNTKNKRRTNAQLRRTTEDLSKQQKIKPRCYPSFAPHVQDLHVDRTQTSKQQGALFVAKQNLIETSTDHAARMTMVYDRALGLYSERLRVIQNEGVERMNLWLEVSKEQLKVPSLRNQAFIAACNSTIVFLEENHMKRKMEFVAEVYAVLEHG